MATENLGHAMQNEIRPHSDWLLTHWAGKCVVHNCGDSMSACVAYEHLKFGDFKEWIGGRFNPEDLGLGEQT